jgi:hypothetical protein
MGFSAGGFEIRRVLFWCVRVFNAFSSVKEEGGLFSQPSMTEERKSDPAWRAVSFQIILGVLATLLPFHMNGSTTNDDAGTG